MSKKKRVEEFFVTGMHCAACELLIEKKCLEIPGVISVDASLSNESIKIETK
ncbi:MAG: heavy-metal-associated domain-containing protein, partial [Candidatus Magasanikbacteria bacterium]|nr:heavy-metal-associated domain-containing protein [Candidatus Magasanikbacteria bacterium]